MLKSILNSTTIPLLQKVAAFGERRHEVLAGNIANIDTPDYKMRDLPVEEFQNALRQAVAQSHKSPSAADRFTASNSNSDDHSRLFPRELFQAQDAGARNLTFQDANNRSIEHQVMELTKNSMMQNYAIQMLTAQMNLLESVITERP